MSKCWEFTQAAARSFDILKKLKDTELADSEKAVTIETNLWQGDLGDGVDSDSEIQTSVAPAEIWLRDDLEKVFALLYPRRERDAAGALQRGLAHHVGVRRSGARSDRLRAVVGAARPRRAL